MKKHTKIYFKHYGYGEQDVILCQHCGSVAVDIHHIEPKGMGGTQKDDINNLIALCRSCHEKAHAGIISKQKLNEIIRDKIKP